MSPAPGKPTKPSLGREGTYYHEPTRQFCSRLGFDLNRDGKRVRASQNLGTDPDQATIRHIQLTNEWRWTKENWGEIRDMIRLGLPDEIRDKAEIDLPVWIKPAWAERAQVEMRAAVDGFKAAMLKIVTDKAFAHVANIEQGRDYLARLKALPRPGEPDLMAMLPDDLRSKVIVATQPMAHEVLGVAPDAERLTVAQAKERYLADKKSLIGLPEDGIKPSTYQQVERSLRLALELKITDDAAGGERYAIDPQAPLDSVGRDEIVAFKRGWLAKVGAGDMARRTAADYCKAVQYFLGWCYKRDRIVSRRIPDLEDLLRFTDVNPINIEDYDAARAKLLTILAKASDRVRLYIYLALNCGYYQVDIGAIKLAEIVERDGDTYIARRREKSSHQNDFVAFHWLWPETAELLEAEQAPADRAENPAGLALLNEGGGPVYRISADAGKVDNVTSAYWRVLDSINAERAAKGLDPIGLQFKQFRKLGATAMNAIAGETVQKLYRAATFEGADRFYVRGDFSQLTAALRTWGETLRKDGILFDKPDRATTK